MSSSTRILDCKNSERGVVAAVPCACEILCSAVKLGPDLCERLLHIIAVNTKLHNCMWQDIEKVAKKRFLFQLFTSV